MPLGSWALFAAVCFVLNLCIVVTASWCRCSKAPAKLPGVPSGLGLYEGATFGVVCVCLALMAVECLAMSRCLEGRLEFLHIPKNAGTAIEIAGHDAGISWSIFNIGFRFRRWLPDGSICSSYHTPPRHLPGLTAYRGAELFCVTRHPYDRALSEYTYLLSVPWGRAYAEDYGNGLVDKPVCTEEGLNHFVQMSMARYREGKRYIDDCHHVAQAEFIWDAKGTQICTNILRSEDLPQAFNSLMARRGYPIKLPEEHANSEKHFCPGLSVHSLSEQTRQMLGSVYADDFRLLNYSAW